ncbi:MAG: PQQ-binding-like beta-propeller repeat protein, partial [Phycisphaerae bacterium]|nr:PQQ-binding-like beta-propeller repeat protein [Phycisphaerae bacterium]
HDLPEANDISSERSHVVRNANFISLRADRLRFVPATRLAGGILPPDIDSAESMVVVTDTFGGLALVPLAQGRVGVESTPSEGVLSPPARYHFPEADELVRQVAFTSDGEAILIRGDSGRAGVIPRDAFAAAFSVGFGSHALGRFTPDGGLVARLGWGSVSVIDAALGLPVWSRPLSSLVFHAAAWSPDGRRLLLLTLPITRTPDSASEVYVVDGDTGRMRLALGLTAYEPDPRLGRAAHPWIGHAADAAFLADGRRAVIAGEDGSLRVLDTDTGVALDGPALPPTSGNGEDPGVRLIPSPDRALLAHLVRRPGLSGGPLRSVVVRDATSLAPVAELKVPGVSATRAAFAPDGDDLLVGYTDGSVVRWRLSDSTPVWRSAPLAPGVVALAISHDGSRVAALCEATQATILDAATGEVLAELPLSGAGASDAVFTPDATLQVTSSATTVASLSPRARLEPVPRASRHLWPEGLDLPATLQRARARVMDAYVLATACSPFGRGLTPALADLESSNQPPETRALAASILRTIGLPLRVNNNEGLLALLAPRSDPQAIRRAADLLAELAQRYPADPPVWANLGHAFARLERWEEAASALEAGAKARRDRGLEPYPQALALLAVAQAALDRPELARQAAMEALALADAAGEPIAPFAPALQARWDALRGLLRASDVPGGSPDAPRR